ncbi:AIPR family protein [Micromonospora sp. WMMD737]|uniref:AIPR family protein n=1 Tax=Micromonospora sp. WMMD737 TaxID=3404113 RepID=UPI003B959599
MGIWRSVLSKASAKKEIPRHVRQIQDALIEEFQDLIDVSDIKSTDPVQRRLQFLSRALAARAVRHLTGCTSVEAATAVIDGRDDYGIDAVAVSDGSPELWLVQAKWSDFGQAGIDTGSANKLVRGFKQMDDQEFGRFNDRFRKIEPQVRAVLSEAFCRVVLVVAVMGDGHMAPEVEEVLTDAGRDFNIFGRTLEHKILTGTDFFQALRDDIAPTPISVEATMSAGWEYRSTPYEAYYGLVSADELAGWYANHGDRLYVRNVRKSLGRTAVNQRLVQTLIDEPEKFWYFNNGITVLCNQVVRHFFGKRDKGQPVRLELINASVVNGAQTVTSAHGAFQEAPAAVGEAFVSVRVIVVDDREQQFATEVTEATNTQNHMERQDFIAIDETQVAIQEDFRLSLRKEYVLKRGDLQPPPEAGCSIIHASIALACAHRNPAMAMRAKRDVSLLWDKEAGIYEQLFGQQPSAYQIWRSVCLVRKVDAALRDLRASSGGRAAAIAEHGDLLITHIVFELIGKEGIEDPDSDWEKSFDGIPDTVKAVLLHMIQAVNSEFGRTSYVSSTFTNEQRCRRLVQLVGSSLAAGNARESLADYPPVVAARPTRRPNTVSLLVNAGVVAEGTALLFQPTGEVEQSAIGEWLDADPRRSRARWTNSKSKPLIWEVDGERYSPSGLTTLIWELAEWRDAWVSVQGPRQWVLPGGETLVQLAEQVWRGDEGGATLP